MIKKEIDIKILQHENKVEGFGGCNGFGGNYTTKIDYNISITNMISITLACPGLDIE